MLYEPGEQLQHAYFPTTAIVSLHYVTESGASAKTAGVGNEGVVGVSLFMGGRYNGQFGCGADGGARLPTGASPAQTGIRAARVPAATCLLRYTQALITQMTSDRRLQSDTIGGAAVCRWLLLTLDRLPWTRTGQ